MKKKNTVLMIAVSAIVIVLIAGWVENIVTIVYTINDPVTKMFILRCVGIIIPPLGAILGFF